MPISSEELAELVKARTQKRKSITKIYNEIEDKHKSDIGFTKDPSWIDYFDSITQPLQQSIESLNNKISPNIEAAKIDGEMESCEDYDRKLIRINVIIKQAKNKQKSANTENKDKLANPENISSNFKLESLGIPKFYGEITKFPAFWEQFSLRIHNNKECGQVDKLLYLRKYIDGKAKKAIDNIPISPQGYDTAVKILQARFGNTEAIKNQYIVNLLNLRPVNWKNSDGLQTMLDYFNTQHRGLQSMDVDVKEYAIVALTLLKKAIPNNLYLEFKRMTDLHELINDTADKEEDGASNAGDNESTVDKLNKLIKFLSREAERKEETLLLRGNNEKHKNYEVTNKGGGSLVQFAHGDISSVCLICKGNHKTSACSNISKLSAEQKKTTIRNNGGCFHCLKTSHKSSQCKFFKKLKCFKCGQRHNTLLHDDNVHNMKQGSMRNQQQTSNKGTQNVTQTGDQNQDNSTGNTPFQQYSLVTCQNSLIMLTAIAKVEGIDKQSKCRIMFDNCGQRSFVSKTLVSKLNCKIIHEEEIRIDSFGHTEPIVEIAQLVELKLVDVFDDSKVITITALAIENLVCDINQIYGKEALQRVKQLSLKLADPALLSNNSELHVDILIGLDWYWQIVTVNSIILIRGLAATETLFGWCLSGHDQQEKKSNVVSNCISINFVKQSQFGGKPFENNESKLLLENDLCQAVIKTWQLDSQGIDKVYKTDLENEFNNDTVQKVLATLKYKDGRYHVGFPFKNHAKKLHDNKSVAYSRFKSNLKKCHKDKSYGNLYNNAIMSYVESGHAEIIPETNDKNTELVYYMPHDLIVRLNSETTKARVVFDVSSSAKNSLSLNDLLEIGPNLNPILLQIIIKFRTFKFAFMGDAQQAFLQIGIIDDHRDCFRFFWVKDFNDETSEVIVFRMIRVPFGASSSPFLLALVQKFHALSKRDEFPLGYKAISENTYVDDVATGSDTESEALKIKTEIIEIMKSAGLNYRKWKSNSPELSDDFHSESNRSTQILGIHWDTHKDKMSIILEGIYETLKKNLSTKRFVLQIVSRIYDPLGIVCPFVIRARILFQKLWKEKLDWDQMLETDNLKLWQQWCDEIKDLNLSLPRWLGTNSSQSVEIHTFCDASKDAFACVSYLRIPLGDQFKTNMIMAKAKVVPISGLTIPRAELQAALIGARLTQNLSCWLNLTVDRMYCWSDSQIVLYQISTNELKNGDQYVTNRINEIRSYNKIIWKFCPGECNPADIPTRGIKAKDLVRSKLWFKGPDWLEQEESEWPKAQTDLNQRLKSLYDINTVQVNCIITNRSGFIRFDRFSSLNKLIRTTVIFFRAWKTFKTKKCDNSIISPEEISNAKKFLIKLAQEESFKEELVCLRNKTPVHKSSRIFEFTPTLDPDGIIRIKGRLDKSNSLTFNQKHPIILSNSHHLSNLIILRSHHHVLHAHVESTYAEVRGNYHILKGKQLTRKILNKCFTCKWLNAKAGKQCTAPLPWERISQAFPFMFTGVDFAGPIYVDNNGVQQKSYITLFTCMVTRSIHLELVSSLSTRNFLMAYRRFVNRRGYTDTMYSDRAKTFIRAKQDLEEIWEKVSGKKITQFLAEKNIKWEFSCEFAPWWGGFYERLVKTVKDSLHKVVRKSYLTFEEMLTVLTDIESTINSRPLTYVSGNPDEPIPLTPSHLLIGRRSISLPEENVKASKTSNKVELIRRWNHRKMITDHFWRRWLQEYLVQLRTANRSNAQKQTPSLKVDSLVLIKQDKIPRGSWSVGRVLEAKMGRDGNVRSYKLRLSNGSEISRPIQHLYSLEVVDGA